MYRRFGKRSLDLLLTVPALVLLSPFIAILAVIVHLKLGTPVLFRQQRPGRYERVFTIYKLRTMTDARDPDGDLLPDAKRLTSFGRSLRSTSLDELPELINVVRGEMSLVGPRPLLARYTPYFTDDERIRFDVRPGITGLSQVCGRNDLGWDQRIATDVRYVKEHSLALDIQILFSTLINVFTKRGVQVDPGAVMLDFDEERRRRMQEPDR